LSTAEPTIRSNYAFHHLAIDQVDAAVVKAAGEDGDRGGRLAR